MRKLLTGNGVFGRRHECESFAEGQSAQRGNSTRRIAPSESICAAPSMEDAPRSDPPVAPAGAGCQASSIVISFIIGSSGQGPAKVPLCPFDRESGQSDPLGVHLIVVPW
jgi:hypothetical protein